MIEADLGPKVSETANGKVGFPQLLPLLWTGAETLPGEAP